MHVVAAFDEMNVSDGVVLFFTYESSNRYR